MPADRCSSSPGSLYKASYCLKPLGSLILIKDSQWCNAIRVNGLVFFIATDCHNMSVMVIVSHMYITQRHSNTRLPHYYIGRYGYIPHSTVYMIIKRRYLLLALELHAELQLIQMTLSTIQHTRLLVQHFRNFLY